jgi:hypothetical protein
VFTRAGIAVWARFKLSFIQKCYTVYAFSEMLLNELLLFKDILKEIGVFFHCLIMSWGCSMTDMYCSKCITLWFCFRETNNPYFVA